MSESALVLVTCGSEDEAAASPDISSKPAWLPASRSSRSRVSTPGKTRSSKTGNTSSSVRPALTDTRPSNQQSPNTTPTRCPRSCCSRSIGQVTRIRSGSSPVPARRELLPPPPQPTTVGQGELAASQSRVSSSCCVSCATRPPEGVIVRPVGDYAISVGHFRG